MEEKLDLIMKYLVAEFKYKEVMQTYQNAIDTAQESRGCYVPFSEARKGLENLEEEIMKQDSERFTAIEEMSKLI